MHPTISTAISTKIRSKQCPRSLCEIWRFCDFVFVQTNRNIVLNINFLWMGLTFRQLYCIIHIVLNNHELLTLVLLSPFFCSTHFDLTSFYLRSRAYALLFFIASVISAYNITIKEGSPWKSKKSAPPFRRSSHTSIVSRSLSGPYCICSS